MRMPILMKMAIKKQKRCYECKQHISHYSRYIKLDNGKRVHPNCCDWKS